MSTDTTPGIVDEKTRDEPHKNLPTYTSAWLEKFKGKYPDVEVLGYGHGYSPLPWERAIAQPNQISALVVPCRDLPQQSICYEWTESGISGQWNVWTQTNAEVGVRHAKSHLLRINYKREVDEDNIPDIQTTACRVWRYSDMDTYSDQYNGLDWKQIRTEENISYLRSSCQVAIVGLEESKHVLSKYIAIDFDNDRVPGDPLLRG